MFNRLMTAAILVLALMLAGQLATAQAGTVACDLITQDEAQAALGMPVKKGEAKGPNQIGQTICFFDTDQDDKVRFVQVTLVDPPARMKENGMTAAKLYEDSMGMIEAKPVDGLGEKAAWGGSGMKLGAGLHVLKGEYYLTLLVAGGNEAKNLAASMELAQKALDRLP